MRGEIWNAAIAQPDQDGPRRVLADLLLSEGDPLGEIISLQCRQTALGLRFEPQAAARLRELWASQGAELPQRFVDARVKLVFDRGLPAIARATAHDWLSLPEPPAPIVTLELSDVTAPDVLKLLARAGTKRLSGLRLRAPEGGGWPIDVAAALARADLPQLEHLALFDAWRDPAAAHTFAAGPVVRGLKGLELGHSLSSDQLRVLQTLARTAPQLRELSIYDDLPVPTESYVGHCLTVSFPDSYVRPELSEALARRVALYLPPGMAGPQSRGGPKCGQWQSVTPLGARNGLDASLAREETSGLMGLLLRTRSLTAEPGSPRDWLAPGMELVDAGECSLGPIDRGVAHGCAWAVFALATGERLDRLIDRQGRLHLSAGAHAALWSKLARWTVQAKSVRPLPLWSLYAGPRGLQAQPFCDELRLPSRHHLFTRREWMTYSPEAVRGEAVDASNASWVLAMQFCLTMGFEVLGRTVTDLETLDAILHGPQIDLYGYGLPPRLRDVLKASLSRNRAQRPPPEALAEAFAVFDTAATRSEVSRLPRIGEELERAREQAEGWLEGTSVHEPQPMT